MDLWWKLFGKGSVDNYILGRRMQGYSDEDILKMMKESKAKFDKRQIKFAESILKDEDYEF